MNRFFKIIVYNTISFFLVVGVLFALGWRFIKRPKRKFWKVKKREEYPEILKDKLYGEHKFIQLQDVKLHYVESGSKDKDLLLFVHGFPEFWFSWRNQIKEFSKDYWVIAIDMRGYGESEKKKKVKSYEMHLLVEDINNFIKALDVKKFTIVAHDWGGVVGHYYIRTYPEKLNKYILLNTAYSRTFNKSIMKSWKQFKKSFYIFVLRVRDVPEYLMALDDFFIFDIMLQKLASPEEIEAYKYTYRNYEQRNGPFNYYRANFTTYEDPGEDLTNDALNASKVRGIYIHGDDDVALTVEAAFNASFEGVENVKYFNVPHADHFVHQSNPQKVNEIMRDFLKS